MFPLHKFSHLLFILISPMLALTACETRQEQHSNLPWQIEQDEQKRSSVFGITLGETTLKEAQQIWRSASTVALFTNQSGEHSLEAYFERLNLGPFQIKMVAVLKAENAWLDTVQQQGETKPKPGPSGDYKYSLDKPQQLFAESFKIVELSYIPSYKVEGEILRQRFGEPEKIKTENENTEYWFYPNTGLMVTINQPGRDVFHYVNSRDFAEAMQRILPAATNI